MKVELNNWIVTLVNDSDNHLSVYIKNKDQGIVKALNADIGSDYGMEWGERFTTDVMEMLFLD